MRYCRKRVLLLLFDDIVHQSWVNGRLKDVHWLIQTPLTQPVTAIISPALLSSCPPPRHRSSPVSLVRYERCSVVTVPRPQYIGGRGIVFDRFLCLFICLFVYIFLCFFVSKITRKRWIDLHEIFREGVEWPWDDPITFLVNSEKPRDAAMRNTGRGLLCFCTTACCSCCYQIFSNSLRLSQHATDHTHS